MTFTVNFFTEQAFLAFVKRSLSHPPIIFDTDNSPGGDDVVVGATCAFACAAALEALVNRLHEEDGRLGYYDELRLASKIDALAQLENITIDWGHYPWQDINRLIKLRNWLAHNKQTRIGIMGAGTEREWLNEPYGTAPRFDPLRELEPASIKRFYNAVREAGIVLSTNSSTPSNYAFLQTEAYRPYLAG